MLGSLPDDAVDAFLADRRRTGPRRACWRPSCASSAVRWAARTPAPVRCPLLDGQFVLFGVAIAATPEMGAAGQADADALVTAHGAVGATAGST